MLPQAAAWLTSTWTGSEALDLSTTIVVVPTGNTGRRLRETLAALAADRGQAVFPPLVLTPEQLVATCAPERGVASAFESQLAWIEVFREIADGAFTEVFPHSLRERDTTSLLRLAGQFIRLQETLASHGLRIASLLTRADGDFPERVRWSELTELERRYDVALARRALSDPQTARIAAASTSTALPGDRLVLLATPDPVVLAVKVVEHFAASRRADVVVYGPENEDVSKLFDAWGRPRTDVWSSRYLSLPDFEGQVHLCADPTAQAREIAAQVVAHSEPAQTAAIGLAGPNLAAPLRDEFQAQGIPAHDPQGRLLGASALGHLITFLASFARDPAFATLEAMARCPDIHAWLQATCGPSFSVAHFLADLDRLRRRHLPNTIAEARSHLAARQENPEAASESASAATLRAIDALDDLQHRLASASFPDSARQALAELFAVRTFDAENARDTAILEAARAWSDALTAIQIAATTFSATDESVLWALALNQFRTARTFPAADPNAIQLSGWLELLWEDAPHLLVAGFNDGSVPSSIIGDLFLPESLRQQLGLKTNADRLACDNYLLQALIASRTDSGRIDLFLGRTNRTGDPLRPSRLLLLTTDAELPRRVGFLFRDVDLARSATPWRRAWKLAPNLLRPLTRVSVTGFRDYLECPFRFYLKHGLKMEAVDAHKAELDALDFGTLCHAVLEAMGRDPIIRESSDPEELRTFLHRRLERETRHRFGPQLTLPLIIQIESARQRLARAAQVQAEDRAAGWKIEDVERRLEFELEGVTIVGKVDRIDRHEQTGAIRLLDYKTSDTPRSPREAHLRTARRAGEAGSTPDFACFTSGKHALVWQDLQLPLYRYALGTAFPGELSFGYFNLPKAVTDAAIELWEGYDESWQAAAEACMHGVASAIHQRRFGPPARSKSKSDTFAALFHREPEASVVWEAATP